MKGRQFPMLIYYKYFIILIIVVINNNNNNIKKISINVVNKILNIGVCLIIFNILLLTSYKWNINNNYFLKIQCSTIIINLTY